jgi:hypothetical protein
MNKHEQDLIAAAMNLAGATRSHAALLPIPNTTPQLYVAYGEAEQLRDFGEQQLVEPFVGTDTGLPLVIDTILHSMADAKRSKFESAAWLAGAESDDAENERRFQESNASAFVGEAEVAPGVPDEREQFIAGYCERSGVTWEELSKTQIAERCDCGEEGCAGWAMVSKRATVSHASASIGDDTEFINVIDDVLLDTDLGTDKRERATARIVAVVDRWFAARPAVGMVAAPRDEVIDLLRLERNVLQKICARRAGRLEAVGLHADCTHDEALAHAARSAAPDVSVRALLAEVVDAYDCDELEYIERDGTTEPTERFKGIVERARIAIRALRSAHIGAGQGGER